MLEKIQQFFTSLVKGISDFFTGLFGGGSSTSVPRGPVNTTGDSPRALQNRVQSVAERLDTLWEEERNSLAPEVSERPAQREDRHAEITELTEEQATNRERVSDEDARVKTGLVNEPTGPRKRGPWPVYGWDGHYIGEGMENRTGIDLAFVAQNHSTEGNLVLPQLMTENHREFQIIAKIVKLEGTSNEVDEYLWIAHTANNAANHIGRTLFRQLNSSYSSVPSANKTPLPKTDGRRNANSARAGVIDVFMGRSDPTGYSRFWDGTDLLAWGLNSPNGTPHNKLEEYSSMFIPQPVFDKFAAAQASKYGNSVRYYGTRYPLPAPLFNSSTNPGNFGGDQIGGEGAGFFYRTGVRNQPGIIARGAYGESIFWATR